MAVPVIVWTDHKTRLVMLDGGNPTTNDFKLELRDGDPDAMGTIHWRPTELTWSLFISICQSVLAWQPVQLNPDELQ